MEDVVSFLIPSILLLFTNIFARSLFVCIHQSASNLTQFYLLMYFFLCRNLTEWWNKLDKTFSQLIEINAFLVISEALNFKIFWSGCPLDNLAPLVLISNNPKYAVWSLKVKYTVLLIPYYRKLTLHEITGLEINAT